MNRQLSYKYHSQTVSAWIEKSLPKLSREQLETQFEEAVQRLLVNTQTSLSEITLNAVLDRVLYNCSEQYPVLHSIKLDNVKLDFSDLEKHRGSITDNQLKEAFHYLITEFLAVIGSLTAQQLTPFLHRALIATSNRKSSKSDKKDEQ